MPESRSESRVTRVPVEALGAGVKTVISIVVASCLFTIGWVQLRAELAKTQSDVGKIQVDVTEIRNSLKAFDRLASMQAEINDIKKNGSDALGVVRGEVDRLREEFRVHIARTTKEVLP